MHRGFTLIELLTVIAIIGILAAILIPTVGKVRQSARAAQSLSNKRQVALAILSYAQDNKDYAPKGSPGAGQDNVNQNNSWNIEILPYLQRSVSSDSTTALAQRKAMEVLSCPAFIADRQPTETQLEEGFLGVGLNIALGVPENPTGTLGPRNAQFNRIRLSRFSAPTRIVLIGDTDQSTNSSQRYQMLLSTYNDPATVRNNGGLRHGAKATYAFAGGNASMLTPEEATSLLRPNP